MTATAQAQTYYTDRVSFDAANPGLALEDFNEATLVSSTAVTAPLDKFSNNVNFTPGQIKDGLRINTVGTAPNEFFVNNSYGNPFDSTTVVTTNYSSNSADLSFYNDNVTSVGLDLYGGSYILSLYSSEDFLIGTQVVDASSGAFFGVTSPYLIKHITLNNTSTFETFDNIAFGGQTTNSSVPEPGSLALLSGIAVSGLGFLLRRKRSRK